MDRELFALLSCEVGHVIGEEELCPGVYYVTILPELKLGVSCDEYYVVVDNAPISQEARALGQPLPESSALLYLINPQKEGAWTAVMYELCKYRAAHGLPNPDGWSPVEIALRGMELCPIYFGAFPVPPRTPWGWTLRHRALDNGIYWIETSQGSGVLALSNPVWFVELSEGVQQVGKKLNHAEVPDENELDYLFFNEQTSCTAIFELLMTRPEWLNLGLIRKPELMNAIWKYAPGYAAAYNVEEQAGLHDGLGLLFRALGEERELEGSPEEMIALDPNAETDFIGFWK